VAADVLVLQRTEVLRDGLLDRLATVVEIAPELVLVSPAGGDVHVAPRGDVDAVVARIPISTSVVVDAAEGVAGAVQLAAAIANRLRANGVAVSIADRDWVLHGVEPPPLKEVRDPQVRPSTNPGRRATAVVVGALLSAVALCGGFMSRHDVDTSHAGMPMTLVVEGRVGVLVPAQWVVQRVTAGPGSARLQVVSPTDVDIAIHVTQSSLAPHSSQDTVAASLRDALGEEAVGLFVDFNPSDRWADRPVVTYREMRAGHSIAWAVLIDKSARIAIGCQSAPGQEETVREVCDRAIRSAHAVF
jgi:type VII secretion-associated protein (TIGR03931 family)